MITLERIKELFLALKLHFTSKYDFVKYHGKIRTQAIQQRERWSIERIARKYREEDDVRNFLVANMLHSFLKNGKVDTFIGNYSTKEAIEIYEQSDVWWNAMSYNFTSDLKKFDSIKDAIFVDEGNHPKVFTAFIDGKISFNTIICLVIKYHTLLTYWQENCDDTVLFGSYIVFLRKYIPLVSKDTQKINEVIQKYTGNT